MKLINETEIREKVTVGKLIEKMDAYLSENREMEMIDRMHMEDEGNTVLIMPSFDPDYYAIKLAGVAPGNRELQKPTIHASVILHDRNTLEPLAFMDGTAITELRTGAIGGLSMKYLSKKSARSIGIVGTGIQGWSHLEAGMAVRDIEEVYLHNRSPEKLEAFKNRVREAYPDVTVKSASVEELVESSDIIVTTTTSSTPVLPDREPSFWEGKHIVAVGSFRPDMQELPESLLKIQQTFFVDTPTALKESGDMLKAKELHGDGIRFSSLTEFMDRSNEIEQPFTVFKSVGMALYDLITAKTIYEQSVRYKATRT
ncbi:ornithine cyclodeaminase family protein [Pseudalkalibacillus sp. Hm43]|uniref:ornithine cyclodeaminase family protein n=1 Tax=Pseudalkalibacillus sp. Hm43 TaxID=3450742 RepID=UPI003F437026